MFHFVSTFLVFCAVMLTIQADLDISFFGIDVPYYHPDYFKDVEFYLLDDDKIFGNVTIINYLPSDIMFRVSIIGATMGEYKISTGFDLELPMCEIFKDPILSAPVLKTFNFPPDICPPKLGTYVADNFETDFSLYPEEFPPNNYLVKSEFYNQQERFFELNTYQRVS